MSVWSSIEAPDAGRAASASRNPAVLQVGALRLAAVLGVVGVALLFRPYLGLFGDARIYVGRALATLDPSSVGRDMMFVYDRQSGLSLFPALLTRAVAWLGPSAAATAVALLALTVWTLSAAGALRAFAGRRHAVLALLCVLVLPSAYGGFQITVGEAAPLPRPFAEGLVLLGLWALMRDRLGLAAGLMAVAAAVHPIMALPGLGVMGLTLCLQDRRWLLVPAAGVMAVLAGSALGLPLAGRLLVAMDGRWLGVLHNRSPFLFLSRWPPTAWSQLVFRAATLGGAALFLQARARRIAIATLAVAALSLGAAAVLGDGLSSVLVLQAQPWRGLWLVSFLASAAAPLVALRLWERGSSARLAAGLLACAWITTAFPLLSIGTVSAAGLAALSARRGVPLPRRVLLAGWAVSGLGAALAMDGETLSLIDLTWGVPEALRRPLDFYLLQDVYRAAAGMALVGAVVAWRGRAVASTIALPAAVLLAAVGAAGWRAPDSGRRLLVSPEAAREVRALTASRSGAVHWLGGDLEPVMLAGRPAWWTEVQAASSVFSRDQALLWAARRQRLVDTGVGPPSLLAPFPHENPRRFWTPTPAAVRAFCTFPDAPAWLVTPLRAGAATPEGAVLWRAPVVTPRVLRLDGPAEAVDVYAFQPCGRAGQPAA